MVDSPSDFEQLGSEQAFAVLRHYRVSPAFFPLIGAVLAGDQDGTVHADAPVNPRQVYIEHAFGFAQVFGESVPTFEAALRRYLLIDSRFAAPKVRLYTPQLPSFLAGADAAPLCSERRRFHLEEGTAPVPPEREGLLDCVPVDASNYERMQDAFGVALRFWRSAADFVAGGRAVVARVDGQPAAICYAAAVSDARAEIDVMTLPAWRMRGAARFAVAHFVQRCLREGIQPLWDCFNNNAGSLKLCRASGFVPAAPPYPFFTIGK
jgi:hypothetical protein